MKLSFPEKNPPNSGRKNTTNINIVRNTARPKISLTVVWMKWDAINWNAIIIFIFLISMPSGLLDPKYAKLQYVDKLLQIVIEAVLLHGMQTI